MLALLLDAIFSSVALGHMAVDIMNGQRATLLAYLSGPLGLSNTELGLASTLYVVSGAFSQPVFGWAADRVGARWITAGGVLAMAVFFCLAVITPGPGALVLLMLASIGSGAFHPAGTMQATLRGRTHYAGRETTAAATFFFFGQAGNFMGPVAGGPLLDRFGPSGLLLIGALAFPVGLNAAHQLRAVVPQPTAPLIQISSQMAGSARRIGRLQGRLLPLAGFALLAAFQAWSQQNMITFVPKYLKDLGLAASVYGLVASLFMGGSAVGNAVGGILADRYGKRRVAVLALGLAAVPLYFTGIVGWSAWLYLLVPLAGLLTGATHSIIVVLAQRHIPGGMALASGLILGFMFSSGALGTLVSGFLADRWGLPPIFRFTALIALAAAFLALSLRDPSGAPNGKTQALSQEN
jgi:FSR family fosmidomycin resistance protein-like MFS transporter